MKTRFDPRKFDNPLQVGGIRTGTLDYPNPGGAAGCRVAHVDTGSGLRFTVALDRGGDVVEASYRGVNLAYLTANDYKPSIPTDADDMGWLTTWPGGLLTTCGPVHMGEPRHENGMDVCLHGRHSNTPAAVELIENPDPARKKLAMRLGLSIRDTRMFGPHLETRRRIECRLGEPVIEIHDEVINRGDKPSPHALLYHVNFGYPLLDLGSQMIAGGRAEVISVAGSKGSDDLDRLKTIPRPLASHAGEAETVLVLDSLRSRGGTVHAGLINNRLGLAVELRWPLAAMPRMAVWQHFAPHGSYAMALEPFSGSLVGMERDDHPDARQQLAPGESKTYSFTIDVHDDARNIQRLARHDQPIRTR